MCTFLQRVDSPLWMGVADEADHRDVLISSFFPAGIDGVELAPQLRSPGHARSSCRVASAVYGGRDLGLS